MPAIQKAKAEEARSKKPPKPKEKTEEKKKCLFDSNLDQFVCYKGNKRVS